MEDARGWLALILEGAAMRTTPDGSSRSTLVAAEASPLGLSG